MTKYVELTKGQKSLVDSEDYIRVSKYSWYTMTGGGYRKKFYAAHKNGKKFFLLHRFILGISDRKIKVDHINGNSLDNRKSNLRIATDSQNQANSKISSNNKIGYKGVIKVVRTYKLKKPYTATIMKDGKPMHLGYFSTARQAAKAYDKKAVELFGEFAKLNFKKGSK